MNKADTQYRDLCQRIITEGVNIPNPRTGKFCRTVINADFVYDVGKGEYPIISTRKAGYKFAIAELLGYIRGYSSAKDFRKVGCKTWDANANLNKAWLANPHRKGKDDMGKVYGAVARDFGGIDLWDGVVSDLSKGIDNRGEIVTFWKPDDFYRGCLRPCMHSHQFSILDDTLYLNSTQRSVDVPLGLVANMQQCYVLLAIMAQVCGLKAGKVFHKLVNCHLYEDQIELMKKQLQRTPVHCKPRLNINRDVMKLEDFTLQDFKLANYLSHEPIKYPFSE